MKRRFLLLLVALLATSGLAACGSGGTTSPPSSDLDAALAIVPDDASFVEFFDRQAMADRLGVGDLRTGASADDVLRYQQAVSDQPVPGTTLFLPTVAQMQQAAFSELDVRWSVIGTVGGTSFQAFELDPDVDLAALASTLAASGFTEGDLAGRPHLTATPTAVVDPASGLVLHAYPASFLDVTVDPARHLLVVGPATSAVLAAVDGGHPSLAASGSVAPVLPPSGGADVEVALLDPSPSCGSAIGNLSRAQRLQVVRASAALGTPRLRSYVVTGGTAATASLLFADDADATADAAARTAYLRTGRLVVSGQLLSTLGSPTVTATGPLVTVTLDHPELGRTTEVAERGDGFLLCRTSG